MAECVRNEIWEDLAVSHLSAHIHHVLTKQMYLWSEVKRSSSDRKRSSLTWGQEKYTRMWLPSCQSYRIWTHTAGSRDDSMSVWRKVGEGAARALGLGLKWPQSGTLSLCAVPKGICSKMPWRRGPPLWRPWTCLLRLLETVPSLMFLRRYSLYLHTNEESTLLSLRIEYDI